MRGAARLDGEMDDGARGWWADAAQAAPFLGRPGGSTAAHGSERHGSWFDGSSGAWSAAVNEESASEEAVVASCGPPKMGVLAMLEAPWRGQ